MNDYDVEVYEEVGGVVSIRAHNKKEAEQNAQQVLDYYGLEGFGKMDLKIKHRDAKIITVTKT